MIDYSGKFTDQLVPIFRKKLSRGDLEFPLLQAPVSTNRPTRSYATMEIMYWEDAGQMEEGLITESGQQIKQHQNVVIRINVYGKGAKTRASILKTSLQYPSMTEAFYQIGVCWRNSSDVKDISALVSTEHEERATFDIRLGTVDGDFSVLTYDPSTEGLPSKGAFDEDIVPVESVYLGVSVAEEPEGQEDFIEFAPIYIDTNN